jgi:hypothetical protein
VVSVLIFNYIVGVFVCVTVGVGVGVGAIDTVIPEIDHPIVGI